jgi:hypothetical protein
MKTKIFILIACFIVSVNVGNAQNVIAVQHGGTNTFYTTLDSAIAMANSGDNVYIPGGNLYYLSGTILVNKPLNIFGVGYNLDSNIATLNTNLTTSPYTFEILPGSSGGSITGISAPSYTFKIHDSVSNYSISRCLFGNITLNATSNFPSSNITIIETIVSQLTGSCSATTSPENIFVSKCFIGNYGGYVAIASDNPNYQWQGLFCSNCVLYGKSYWFYGGSNLLNYIFNSTFQNCVIMDNNGNQNIGGGNNIFRNCLFNKPSDYAAPSTFNCIFNQDIDSTFVNRIGDGFDIHGDYHLKLNSPGRNAGTDGLDVGIYGTASPFKIGGLPYNPHIMLQSINSSTNQQGDLPVNITVEVQNH